MFGVATLSFGGVVPGCPSRPGDAEARAVPGCSAARRPHLAPSESFIGRGSHRAAACPARSAAPTSRATNSLLWHDLVMTATDPPDKYWHCLVEMPGQKSPSVVNDL